jgi:hypothetical protein
VLRSTRMSSPTTHSGRSYGRPSVFFGGPATASPAFGRGRPGESESI